MTLIEELNTLPMLRPLGLAANLRHVCLICFHGWLDETEKLLQACPQIKAEMLAVADLAPNVLDTVHIKAPSGESIPVVPLKSLGYCPEYEKVFVCPAHGSQYAPLLTELCRYLAKYKAQTVWLYGNEAPEHSLRGPVPDFLRKYEAQLVKTLDILADSASKRAYLGRIKALLAGNAAYMPIAPHREYFHPLVAPQRGDTMLDGGVSDMVEAQMDFARAVGENGRIFGFEPIPRLAQAAADSLKNFPNYHLQCAGLADKPGSAVFADLRDSSTIRPDSSKDTPGTVVCDLRSIDSFCKKNHITHVDCIKLDVEGSELSALRGAREIITRDRPRLIVCLYHKPEDMTEIPLFIKSIAPEYSLYVSHCSCQFMDTVLYAIDPSKKP